MIGMDGVLVLDKPAGVTSHDVVARVRHLLHERRIGHTGTLDPFATGVLILLVGRATRISQFLGGVEKAYEAVFRLGFSTDTGDLTGSPIPTDQQSSGPWPDSELEAAFKSLRGEIEQVPPMYSAKKVGGRKLYEFARSGEEVERQPICVNITKFEPLHPGPLLKDNSDGTFDLDVLVECSAGTYIRALAEDFGKRLNVGAHVAELRRTRVGDFAIDQARTLEQLKVNVAEEAIGRSMRSLDQALTRMPHVDLSDEDATRVRHGLNVSCNADWAEGARVRMRDSEKNLLAVGTFNAAESSLHPTVVFA